MDKLKAISIKLLEIWIRQEENRMCEPGWSQEQYQGAITVLDDLKEILGMEKIPKKE